MQSCVDDVKLWMTKSKLQLNEGKTEAQLIDPQNSPSLPLSKSVKMIFVFSRSVRNLGVVFDNKLSMKQQVSKACQSAYLKLRRISSVRLSTQLMLPKPLWHLWDSSTADWQTSKGSTLFCSTHFQNLQTLLAKLHWLPIAQGIDYKISSLC